MWHLKGPCADVNPDQTSNRLRKQASFQKMLYNWSELKSNNIDLGLDSLKQDVNC